MNKYRYLTILQCKNGQTPGWTDICATESGYDYSGLELRSENKGDSYRIIRRRELTPNWKSKDDLLKARGLALMEKYGFC